MCVECLFLRSPGQAPYGTEPSCANMAAYADPPPVVPDPESFAVQAAYPFGLQGTALLPRSLASQVFGNNSGQRPMVRGGVLVRRVGARAHLRGRALEDGPGVCTIPADVRCRAGDEGHSLLEHVEGCSHLLGIIPGPAKGSHIVNRGTLRGLSGLDCCVLYL